MRRPLSKIQTIRMVIGLIAAIALIVRGVMDRDRGGWVMVLVGIIAIAAVALRSFVYRD